MAHGPGCAKARQNPKYWDAEEQSLEHRSHCTAPRRFPLNGWKHGWSPEEQMKWECDRVIPALYHQISGRRWARVLYSADPYRGTTTCEGWANSLSKVCVEKCFIACLVCGDWFRRLSSGDDSFDWDVTHCSGMFDLPDVCQGDLFC